MKHQGMMLWQRGVALLAAAALLVLGLVGLSMTPAAHADTTIDSNQLGSITVHALTKSRAPERQGRPSRRVPTLSLGRLSNWRSPRWISPPPWATTRL